MRLVQMINIAKLIENMLTNMDREIEEEEQGDKSNLEPCKEFANSEQASIAKAPKEPNTATS